ncbi:hypothetical protein CUMW_251900 [Citrus unshiu]|uniref:Uncharacterized protein n=1 Tax=Citrus unshiu TaxID=55188 RepID=A0A2H5QQC4_CITUN|nr:hypothetical protein CUMW_251900 [Citrus unshiu]
MEALISQFNFLTNQACQDKDFDPYAIEDFMKLFEIEVYKSWAAVELQQEREVEEAEITMEKAEDYLDLRSWKMPSMSSEGWGIVAKFLRATPPTLEEETPYNHKSFKPQYYDTE